jgi:hypothetical protein
MLWEAGRNNTLSMSTDSVVLTEEDLFEHQYDDHSEQASEVQDPASPERSPPAHLVLTRSSDLSGGWDMHVMEGMEDLNLDACHLPLASSPEDSPRITQ